MYSPKSSLHCDCTLPRIFLFVAVFWMVKKPFQIRKEVGSFCVSAVGMLKGRWDQRPRPACAIAKDLQCCAHHCMAPLLPRHYLPRQRGGEVAGAHWHRAPAAPSSWCSGRGCQDWGTLQELDACRLPVGDSGTHSCGRIQWAPSAHGSRPPPLSAGGSSPGPCQTCHRSRTPNLRNATPFFPLLYRSGSLIGEGRGGTRKFARLWSAAETLE